MKCTNSLKNTTYHNGHIHMKEIKFIIKLFLQRKLQSQMASLVNSIKYLFNEEKKQSYTNSFRT